MSDLYQSLKMEFRDPDYRYGYAESFLNTKLATQIKTLREQRGKTQAEISAEMGITQPGYRRFEDANHSVWKTDSLWNIARANGVRLDISFKSFGSLLDDKRRFDKESLRVPEFSEDPAFKDQAEEPEKTAAAMAQTTSLQRLANAEIGDAYPDAYPPAYQPAYADAYPETTLGALAQAKKIEPRVSTSSVIDIGAYRRSNEKLETSAQIPTQVVRSEVNDAA